MNKLIISNLQLLEKQAINRGEIYRAKAFRNAYRYIENLDYEIKNVKQLKKVRGIGKGIHERISKILLNKTLEEIEGDNYKDKIIEKFISINGVGFKTAEKWYNKGYRTIEDILKYEGKHLTDAQRIGIKYKDEISQKIPRERIDEINEIIMNVIQEINEELSINLCSIIAGSYRRGKLECGDIDCLVTEKNSLLEEKHIKIFLNRLKNIKLLTDDIALGPSKYLGICIDKLGIHRRIDFEFVYDYNSFTYELLYFTGSGETNILMRQAAKGLGLLLNQHGLYKNGKLISAKNEREIFAFLKLDYLEPEDR